MLPPIGVGGMLDRIVDWWCATMTPFDDYILGLILGIVLGVALTVLVYKIRGVDQ